MSTPATTTAPSGVTRSHEAELVVMHVDGAESPEAVGGKLGLHAGHHLTDGRMALGL